MGKCPTCGVSFLEKDYCPECGHVLEEVARLRLVFRTPDELREQFGRFPTFEHLFVPCAQPVPEGTLVELDLVLPAPWVELTMPVRVVGMAPTPSSPATPYRLQLSPVRMGQEKKALLRSIIAGQTPPSVPHVAITPPPPSVPPAPSAGDEAPSSLPAPAREPRGHDIDIGDLLKPLPRSRPRPAVERLVEEFEEHEASLIHERPPEVVSELLAEFVRRLTRALVSSSYYDADHASALTAKVGLYDSFRMLLGKSPEITLLDNSTEAKRSVLVHGIFEDPTPLERVMPTGQADLLVPKLAGYLEARTLLSVAFKRSLEHDEFHRFVDLLANQGAGRGDARGFASSLAAQRIENVSVVFKEEMLSTRKLTWRVALALTRLRKDLSVIPLYKGRSPAEMHRVRVEVFRDVVRPLRQIRLLRELLINCDLVAHDVKDLSREEMERLIQEAILPAALPDLLAVFAEDVLAAIRAEPGRSEHLLRLTRNLARKLAGAPREVQETVFRQLFDHEVLKLEELPAALQDRIRIERKADVFLTVWRRQLQAFDEATSAEEYRKHVDFFTLVFAELLVRQELDVAERIALRMSQHSAPGGFPGRPALAAGWLARIGTGPAGEEIVRQLMDGDKQRRKSLLMLCGILGEGAVPILFRALCDCPTRVIRQEICDLLEALRSETGRFLAAELRKQDLPWYFRRNLLHVLGRVGGSSDLPLARRFLEDPHPRVRLQAFLAACYLDPAGTERALIRGLADADPDIRAVCLRQLVDMRSTAPELFDHARAIVTNPPPGAEESAAQVCELLASYLGEGREQVVELMLDIVGEEPRKGFWSRLAGESGAREAICVGACHALGRLRAEKAVPILAELAESRNGAVKQAAAHALRAIQAPPEAAPDGS